MAHDDDRARRIRWILGTAFVAAGVGIAIWALRTPAWRPEIVDIVDGTALSPDGTTLAWVAGRRLHTSDGQLRPEGAFGEPRWTRDGELLAADGDQLVVVPLDGAPIPLGTTGRQPAACGAGVVFLRGDRLFYKPLGGDERELLRAYADEELASPRCDPRGERVVVIRDGDALVIDVEGKGRATPLTSDHRAGSAVFAADGETVLLGALVEVPATGGEPRRVLEGASSPELSRDGATLLFARDATTFVLQAGRRTLPSRDARQLRVASPTTLVAERDGAIVAIDTITGAERALTSGHRPFPSLDGATVYFRAAGDPARLLAIPLAGGTPRPIATLPGRIVAGVDGPDGQHVMIDEPEHHLVSNRVGPDGTLTDEGAHWVVPAPRGGWRFWQRPGAELELRVIAPGKPLGSMDCVFTVESSVNQWLDDHRLAYLHGGTWQALDVRTCTDGQPHIETLGPGSAGSVIATDGQVYSIRRVPRVTRHLITNFATRPR